MALPEKLYTLRKKSGLSQEQLAEALNVSRQAISKWEGGSAMPESDKLLALSNYFGVSLDYLLKDGTPDAAPAEAQEEQRAKRRMRILNTFLLKEWKNTFCHCWMRRRKLTSGSWISSCPP